MADSARARHRLPVVRALLRTAQAHPAEVPRGGWPEGHLLPSEAELCTQYAVSRTVVRQALADLERDGLVLSSRARGRS